jgi:hexosaminidase
MTSSPYSIVPLPKQIEPRPGELRLLSSGGNPEARIQHVMSSALADEAYVLNVTPDSMQIDASGERGFLLGRQTLRQLITPSQTVPCVCIHDAPRFRWRGAHLDVSRHFFGVEFIKRYLDILALHKLNVFHWHLTDDQGWRIEIKSYPRLTEVGAWRVNREHLPWNQREPQRAGDVAEYGGFYSQNDVHAIVRYAEARGITIVPEIEMPAHALAALAAYPEFSCMGGPFTVPPGQYWPISHIFCAGNDKTFDFLASVLGEVSGMFPGPFVHVGGDEADKTEWKRCAKCQQRMQQLGLRTEDELQGWFMRRVGMILTSLRKRMIGWDEILDDELQSDAVIMAWRGIERGALAARRGHDVVMSPATHCYFDHYQGAPEQEPEAFGGFTPLNKVYEFEPVPNGLSLAETAHILGAQANLWTEFIATAAHAEYMLLPRLAALAEVGWSPKEARDYADFHRRLELLQHRYEELGLNYSRRVA